MTKHFFSIILPAYNEAKNLGACVNEIKKALGNYNYEIIIAEDGSTDNTYKIAKNIANKIDGVRIIHDEKKLGRGLALKRAFKIAQGSVLAYLDVDMATHMKHLNTLLFLSNSYDVVTASRYLTESKIKRPALRMFVSKTYNYLIRSLLGCTVYDSQCGFKAFSKKFVEKEIFAIKEKSWAWDTIVLVTAIKKQYLVKEFPVEWNEKKEIQHSSSIKRILKDTKIHGTVLAKLFLKYRLGLDIVV